MAKGVNKVILIGNCGADPETRYLPSGGAVTNVRLATSETWKDKTSGQQQERTEWHRVVFFNRLAEIAAVYLKKGSKVYVEGQFAPASGKTRKAKTSTQRKSSPPRCRCSTAVRAAVAAWVAAVTPTTTTPRPANSSPAVAPRPLLSARWSPWRTTFRSDRERNVHGRPAAVNV